MRRKILLALCILCCASTMLAEDHEREDSIKWAVIYQLEHYPESELRDVYKNFMQDYFGPGHILKDKEFLRDFSIFG